jgi:hypothetical protein
MKTSSKLKRQVREIRENLIQQVEFLSPAEIGELVEIVKEKNPSALI